MSSILILISKLALIMAPLWALQIGDAMPDNKLKLKNVDGHEISLSDAATSKGLLVIFSSNVCPKVKAWENRIRALSVEFVPQGIGFIAVNSNDPTLEPGDSFEKMKIKGYPFPYVKDPDGKLADAFDAQQTPETFLFDAKHRLVYHGGIDDNAENPAAVKHRPLRKALESLLKGTVVKNATSAVHGSPIVRKKRAHKKHAA